MLANRYLKRLWRRSTRKYTIEDRQMFLDIRFSSTSTFPLYTFSLFIPLAYFSQLILEADNWCRFNLEVPRINYYFYLHTSYSLDFYHNSCPCPLVHSLHSRKDSSEVRYCHPFQAKTINSLNLPSFYSSFHLPTFLAAFFLRVLKDIVVREVSHLRHIPRWLH